MANVVRKLVHPTEDLIHLKSYANENIWFEQFLLEKSERCFATSSSDLFVLQDCWYDDF